MDHLSFHPVLSCQRSFHFEQSYFKQGGQCEAKAMQRAGEALGHHIIKELGSRISKSSRILLLLGKGHNSGDALIAVHQLKTLLPKLQIDVLPLLGVVSFAKTVQSWFEQVIALNDVTLIDDIDLFFYHSTPKYDLSIDGVFGMQFTSPLSDDLSLYFHRINQLDINIRIAVDLPSGLSDQSDREILKADFTFATGILKSPLLDSDSLQYCGRIRYLDIGFFDDGDVELETCQYVIAPYLLSESDRLRDCLTDKRSYGHLLIVAGSSTMPGAMLMAVESAVQSGVGLVSVLAPASICASAASRVPEAMWIPCQESEFGGFSSILSADCLDAMSKSTALLMGPGIGNSVDAQAFLDHILAEYTKPVVLDADALQKHRVERMLAQSDQTVVLTPHLGEFLRISGMDDEVAKVSAVDYVSQKEHYLVMKGSITKMIHEGREFVSPNGGPVLARGGSGDILAGLIAGKVANSSYSTFMKSVAGGIVLHGYAADRLASSLGEQHVRTTQILQYLSLF